MKVKNSRTPHVKQGSSEQSASASNRSESPLTKSRQSNSTPRPDPKPMKRRNSQRGKNESQVKKISTHKILQESKSLSKRSEETPISNFEEALRQLNQLKNRYKYYQNDKHKGYNQEKQQQTEKAKTFINDYIKKVLKENNLTTYDKNQLLDLLKVIYDVSKHPQLSNENKQSLEELHQKLKESLSQLLKTILEEAKNAIQTHPQHHKDALAHKKKLLGLKGKLEYLQKIDGSNKEAINERINQLNIAIENAETLLAHDPENPDNLKALISLARDAATQIIDAEIVKKTQGGMDQNHPNIRKLNALKQEIESTYQELTNTEDPKKLLNTLKNSQKIFKNFLKKARQGKYFESKHLTADFKHACTDILNKGEWHHIKKRLILKDGSIAESNIVFAHKYQHFKDLYEKKGVNGICAGDLESDNAMNLASTSFIHKGKTIYRGIRHGVHSALGDSNKTSRLGKNLNRVEEEIRLTFETTCERFLELHNNSNKDLSEQAEYEALKEKISSGKIDLPVLAVGLETGDKVKLISVALSKLKKAHHYLDRHEKMQIKEQMQAWRIKSKELAKRPLEIDIPTDVQQALGQEVQKKAEVTVSKPVVMNFGVDIIATKLPTGLDGWESVAKDNRIAMLQLFSDEDIDINSPKETLSNTETIQKIANTSIEEMKNGATIEGMIGKAIQSEQDLQKKQAMIQLAKQSCQIYLSGSYKSPKNDPYHMVSRLMVLGFMAGLNTSFNCKSGKDRTGMLDAAAKFLAYQIASSENSTVPEPDRKMGKAEQAEFEQFMLETGSLELQKHTVGVPGYMGLLAIRGKMSSMAHKAAAGLSAFVAV